MTRFEFWIPYVVLFTVCVYLALGNIKKSRTVKQLSGIWPAMTLQTITAIAHEAQQRFKDSFHPDQLVFVARQIVERLKLADQVEVDVLESEFALRKMLKEAADRHRELSQKMADADLPESTRTYLLALMAEVQQEQENIALDLARSVRWTNRWRRVRV